MRKLIIISIFIIFGCKSNEKTKNEFQDYYSLIPTLNFPIKIDCLADIQYFDKSLIVDSLKNKYCPKNYQINGRIPNNENYIAIIYSFPGDNMYPSIFTYNLDGEPIDTLNLGTFCGEFRGTVGRGIINITENINVNLIDSTRFYWTDDNENIIYGTDSSIVTISDYRTENDGHFTKILEKKETILNRK